jgi:hypothetical protein
MMEEYTLKNKKTCETRILTELQIERFFENRDYTDWEVTPKNTNEKERETK